jgi:hypothetical protein
MHLEKKCVGPYSLTILFFKGSAANKVSVENEYKKSYLRLISPFVPAIVDYGVDTTVGHCQPEEAQVHVSEHRV